MFVGRRENMFSFRDCLLPATNTRFRPISTASGAKLDRSRAQLSGFHDVYYHGRLSMTESTVYVVTCRFEALGFTILRSRSSVSGKCRTSKNKTAA